jgi:hypothetical protein
MSRPRSSIAKVQVNVNTRSDYHDIMARLAADLSIERDTTVTVPDLYREAAEKCYRLDLLSRQARGLPPRQATSPESGEEA